MNKVKTFLVTMVSVITLSFSATSWGMSSALSDMAQDLKDSVRSSSPQAAFSEGAGYIDGGRVRVRFRAPQITGVKLWAVDPPSFSASCSGVDLHLGALSILSKDQLVNLIEQIPAMAPYLVILAIQKMCDGCASAIAEFMEKANQFGEMTFGRCEDNMKKLMDSTGDWGVSSTQVKDSVMGLFTGVEDSPDDAATIGQEGDTDDIESQNLVAKHLRDDGFPSRLLPGVDEDDAINLVLTLTGTILIDVKDDPDGNPSPETTVLEPGRTDNLLYSLIKGEEILGWKCNDDQCMSPEEDKVVVASGNGLQKPIKDIVDPANPNSLTNRLKVYYDLDTDPAKAKLTDEEKEFLPNLPGIYGLARGMTMNKMGLPADFIEAVTFKYALEAAKDFAIKAIVDIRQSLSGVEEEGGKEAYTNIMDRLYRAEKAVLEEYNTLQNENNEKHKAAYQEMNAILQLQSSLKGGS